MRACLTLLTAVAVLASLPACKRWPGPNPGPPTRQGLVTLRGKSVTLVGNPVEAGKPAPGFTAVANDLSTFTFVPGAKVTILASVPSLDTPTCSAETKRFNEEAAKLGDDVQVVTVSMDLPFAQQRWCGAEGVKNVVTVSDFRDRQFGERYGVSMRENGLLARGVFVVGKDGKVAYAQLVPEVSQEPDYEPILAAARAAAGK